MRKIILPPFFRAESSPFFKAYANVLRKLYVHHIRYLQSANNPIERHLNIEFLGILWTTKLLKFKICKHEKSIASNLENVKKRKKYSFDLSPIIKLERSMFLVWKPEILHLKHWYLTRRWSCCYTCCPY